MTGDGAVRRLAAIIAADVVGYSRLLAADEAATLAAMKAHRDELWRPQIEAFGGRIVGTAGHGTLVEFQNAVAAVQCSLAVQRAMVPPTRMSGKIGECGFAAASTSARWWSTAKTSSATAGTSPPGCRLFRRRAGSAPQTT